MGQCLAKHSILGMEVSIKTTLQKVYTLNTAVGEGLFVGETKSGAGTGDRIGMGVKLRPLAEPEKSTT